MNHKVLEPDVQSRVEKGRLARRRPSSKSGPTYEPPFFLNGYALSCSPMRYSAAALALAAGSEDCACVVVQHLEPACDIGRMIWPRHIGDADISAEERRGELGHQLFHRLGVFAPRSRAAPHALQIRRLVPGTISLREEITEDSSEP